MSGELIQVEVAYALPAEQVVLRVDLPSGATVRDAVARSGLWVAIPTLIWSGSGWAFMPGWCHLMTR